MSPKESLDHHAAALNLVNLASVASSEVLLTFSPTPQLHSSRHHHHQHHTNAMEMEKNTSTRPGSSSSSSSSSSPSSCASSSSSLSSSADKFDDDDNDHDDSHVSHDPPYFSPPPISHGSSTVTLGSMTDHHQAQALALAQAQPGIVDSSKQVHKANSDHSIKVMKVSPGVGYNDNHGHAPHSPPQSLDIDSYGVKSKSNSNSNSNSNSDTSQNSNNQLKRNSSNPRGKYVSSHKNYKTTSYMLVHTTDASLWCRDNRIAQIVINDSRDLLLWLCILTCTLERNRLDVQSVDARFLSIQTWEGESSFFCSEGLFVYILADLFFFLERVDICGLIRQDSEWGGDPPRGFILEQVHCHTRIVRGWLKEYIMIMTNSRKNLVLHALPLLSFIFY